MTSPARRAIAQWVVASAVAASGCSSVAPDVEDPCETGHYRALIGTSELVVMPLDSTYGDWDRLLVVGESIDLDASVRQVIGVVGDQRNGCSTVHGAQIGDDIRWFSSDEAVATVDHWQGTVVARSAGVALIKVRANGAGIERDIDFWIF